MTERRKTKGGTSMVGGVLLTLLVVAGCSGIEPYEPRDHREDGPKSGLLTGEQGEFVIFRVRSKPKGEEDPQGGQDHSETREEESDTE